MIKIKKNALEYLLLVFLLFFLFFKTYSLHFNYRFPYHHDEWQHLALSIQAMEEGYNKQYNPYLGQKNIHADLEPGFHLFLSSFFLITGVDPILDYKYLAAIFSVFTAMALFLCTYRLSKKYNISIISVFIFIFLTTNVNILGKNFFIPLTMAMPFLFLFILYYVESITEKDYKKFIFSISLLLLISLIHLPSFTILSIAAFFELIFNIGFITGLSRSNKIKGIFFLVIFFLFFSLLIWKGTFPETRSYIKDLSVFEKGWGKLEITYAVPLLYGIANTILVALGFIYFIFYSDSKIRLRFFIFLSFFSLAIIAMFNIFGFTILIPYSRAVHYAMLAMVPLTALGLSLIIEYLIQFQDIKKNKVLQILLKITIYSIFILCILLHKYDIDQNYRYYTFPVIDEYDFKALLWIKNNLGRDNLFVTPYFMTSAVYPISKNRVISLIPAQMEGGPMGENLNFTYFSCKDKKRVVDETGAQYILSQDKIECPYLKELYFDRDFIYEITSQK